MLHVTLARLADRARATAHTLAWFPPLLARLTVGEVFLFTGWGKLQNLEKVTEFFRDLGVPAPELQAPFVAMVELTGGSLLLLGLCTRLAALPLIGTMVVAIAAARREEITAWDDVFGFVEFLYLVLLVWLVIAGPGRVAVDRYLLPPRDRAPGA
jgi:putative oxidoreductase